PVDKKRPLKAVPKGGQGKERWAQLENPIDHSGSWELVPREHYLAVRICLSLLLTVPEELAAWSTPLQSADIASVGRGSTFHSPFTHSHSLVVRSSCWEYWQNYQSGA